MVVAVFVAILLILVLATVLGAVGGVLVEGLLVVLAGAIVIAGDDRYSRH